MDEPRLSATEYAALGEFRYQLRRFLAFSADRARDAGLSPQQHQLMLAVRGLAGAPTIGVLAERLVLRHHSVVELVDRLEEAGMIKRQRNDDDRREARVLLTPRGERVLRKLTLAHRDELRRTGPELVQVLLDVLETRS